MTAGDLGTVGRKEGQVSGRWSRGRRAREAQAGEAWWPGGDPEPRPRELAAQHHEAPVGVLAPDHAGEELSAARRTRPGAGPIRGRGPDLGGGARTPRRARKRARAPPPQAPPRHRVAVRPGC